MTKKPSYRFVGYIEPWEQKKLGEVADFTKGKGYSKGDLESSGVPIILYGRLYTNYQTIIDDVDTYVTMKKHSVLSEGNEIIVPSSGESSEEISRASVVAKKDVILGGDLNIIRLTEKFSSVFVAITLSNGSQQKELSKRAQGKSVVHLHNSDLKEVNLFYTSLPEQIAIGSFFQDIDQLINLQQRKLEVLKEQKKTYLNLLFPTKGQKKPALRFAGFEDEWKRQNLGHYLVEYNEKTKVENQHELLSSTNNGIEPRTGRVSGESNVGYKVLKKGMIVLSPQNLWLGNINYNSEYELGIVSPSYKIYDIERVDKRYLAVLIHHPYMLFEYGQASVQGASVVRRNLDLDLFKEIQIPLPSIKEQKIIGLFFQKLDRAIAKQEEKVNYLKESKQTLLRKMFI